MSPVPALVVAPGAPGSQLLQRLPHCRSASWPTPRARPGGDGGKSSFVKVLDRLAYNLDMQAQRLGYRGGFPAILRQAHDARPPIAHYIIGALPMVQNIGFFGRYRPYLESHSDSHGATLAQKVNICAVKQH